VNFKFLFSTIVVLGVLSSEVAASSANVGTYNLILKNDLSTPADIEGRSFIGGDILNAATVGLTLNGSVAVDAVTVIGDISGSINVVHGNNIVYSYDSNTDSASIDLGGTGSKVLKTSTELQNEFDAIWDSVEADSAYYASLDSNAEFTGDSNNPRYGSSDASELTVYELSAEALTGTGDYQFSTTPDVPVVVNVDLTGLTSLVINAKSNITDFQETYVLWNFYSTDGTVTDLSFNGSGWGGSILAPYANVSSGTGALDGALAALSYDGTVELHNSLYSYEPPTTTPPSEVPAPAGLAMLGLGLLMMVRQRRANKL
jgi:choice-of-anchor A domain-containing protein/MYXO-CTERM domain-containing protein